MSGFILQEEETIDSAYQGVVIAKRCEIEQKGLVSRGVEEAKRGAGRRRLGIRKHDLITWRKEIAMALHCSGGRAPRMTDSPKPCKICDVIVREREVPYAPKHVGRKFGPIWLAHGACEEREVCMVRV